jgi:hypothetical protein
MPDDLFEGQFESLQRDFANIEARFSLPARLLNGFTARLDDQPQSAELVDVVAEDLPGRVVDVVVERVAGSRLDFALGGGA